MKKPNNHQKILIVRFSSIGDIILTSPIIRCLKKQLPDAEIHYLTKKRYEFTIKYNPYIDKRFYLEDNFSRVIGQLRKEKYTYIVDLHNNLRSIRVKVGLGVKSRSFPKLNVLKWLFVKLKINRMPKLHIVDRYFTALKKLNVVNDNKGLDYFVPNYAKAEDLIPQKILNNFIAVGIGGTRFTKRLPANKHIDYMKKMNRHFVLLGGREDKIMADEILRALPYKVISLCGITNFPQTAALVKASQMVFSNDTSVMHLGAAFQKDIISFWGNTTPDFGMSPYFGKDSKAQSMMLEVENLSCRPCSKLGFDHCPRGHFKCMNDINLNILESFKDEK